MFRLCRERYTVGRSFAAVAVACCQRNERANANDFEDLKIFCGTSSATAQALPAQLPRGSTAKDLNRNIKGMLALIKQSQWQTHP